MKTSRVSALTIAAALVLTSCSGISDIGLGRALTAEVPTSGPIEQGDQVTSATANQFIRVIARPPQPGMTPIQIVQGFLDSSASFDGNHAVARQYLTETASAQWYPGEGVRVYEGIPSLTESGPTVRLVASESGRIAENGTFEVSSPGTEMRARFGLVRADGEWRLSSLPQGLLLSAADVDRAFRTYSIYFFNPEFSTLVPDSRTIPVIGPGLATTLVRRLIDGPNEWLAPAVRTGFPDGVDLNIEAVPVDAGIAKVDLTPSAVLADNNARIALSQQLVWTLRQIPEVQGVSITAGGQPFLVPGAVDPQPRDAWPAVDPAGLPPDAAAYLATSVGVRRIVGDLTRAVAGAAGQSNAVFTDIAIDGTGSQVAGVTDEGELFTSQMAAGSRLVDRGAFQGITGLAYDRSQSLWVVTADGDISAMSPGGRFSSIEMAPLPSDSLVIVAVPSRDGTRVALVVQGADRTTLLLARIVRGSGTGSGIRIEVPLRVESRLADVVDVSWTGPNTLSVLASESAGIVQVYEVALGRGTALGLGSPEAPLSVAAAPGLPTLVGAADGVIYDSTAGTWAGRANGTSPAYPG